MKDYERITQKQGEPKIVSKRVYYRLRELEDKIENGTLIELPCKVGDKVYTNINGICLQNEFTVISVDLLGFSNGLYSWTWHQLGKSVFLTKAEAKNKLEELSKNP